MDQNIADLINITEFDSKTSADLTKNLDETSKEGQQLCSMTECDINTPPAQDSPKNILNILNNDCMQAIFQRVDNVRDFYSAANACVRFQENAIACFSFGEIKIQQIFYQETYNTLLFNSDVDINQFFELFGSRIKSVNVSSIWTDIEHSVLDETLDSISLHCGITLTKLELIAWEGYVYEPKLPFYALETLSLENIGLRNIDPMFIFPKLTTLSVIDLMDQNMDWLANHFPKLIYINYANCEYLTDEILIEFQNCNPQLKSYEFSMSYNSTPFVWKNIEKRLPNIVEINGYMNDFGENIVHLSKLKYLTKLFLMGMP